MMKKTTLFVFALLPFLSIGQQAVQKTVNGASSQKVHKSNIYKTYGYKTEVAPGVNNTGNRTFTQNEIGSTFYDLQTNTSNQRRIINHGDGTISATFTFGENAQSGYPDRGAGYNYFNGTSWMPNATARIETTRNGWPSLTSSNGNEIVISHSGTGGLTLNTRPVKGTGAWTQSIIPTNLGANKDILWPRAAIGGTGDSTLHVVGVVVDAVDTNYRTKGVQRAMLYYRSQDLGATWDIVDSLLTPFDSTLFNVHGGDSYSIDAEKNTVAIAIFPLFCDLIVAKSSNNGDTWSSFTVNDFPIDKYSPGDGRGWDLDSNGFQDSTLFLTTDGSGSIMLDANENVHLAFGTQFAGDPDTSDQFYSVNSLNVLLAYWNESFGNDSVMAIAGYKDYDGNGVDFRHFHGAGGTSSPYTNNPNYRVSGISMPSMGMSVDGKVYVAYSAISEAHTNGTQNYRHIYVIKSNDGGANWTDPADFTPDFNFNLTEHVYPSMAQLVDNDVHIVYQRDLTPGTSVVDETVANYNEIMYLKVDTSLREPVAGINEISKEFNINLYPNPTKNDINLVVSAKAFTGVVNVSVVDALGRVLKTLPLTVSTNNTLVNLNVNDLKNGVYTVIINGNQHVSSKTFIKQ